MERGWDEFLTDRDREVFGQSGYGSRQGFGKRPALLVVDVEANFCGDERLPILESQKTWRNSCGEDAWDALPHIERLLGAARAKGLPVIYTASHQVRKDSWDRGMWAAKNRRTAEDVEFGRADGAVIMEQIAPEPQDLVVRKYKPSGFYGTLLDSHLVQLGVDSVIICGTTTSGCVRATVIDAFSRNYRVTVCEEGTFDRGQASHWINLFDMNAKYADVVALEEIAAYFEALSDGLFTDSLPTTAGY